MEFEATRLPGVILIKPRVYGDDRGFFLETWQQQSFARAGIDAQFVQDNHSHSVRHTLRGLHYQVGEVQGKLVRVVNGSVYDVAVDVRRGSPTLGQWVGAELSAENRHMLWVPPGFAHGYLALSERADFLYKCTSFWNSKLERCIRWDDPDIGVSWPLPRDVAPLLSPRDAVAGGFRAAELL